MDRLKNSNEEGMVISIDYEKCFDHIEKDSLLGAMKTFNFGDKFISWVNTMYSGSTLRLLNNGYLTDPIAVIRGCKQGSPASPYYFLICAELLAVALRNNETITGFENK